MASKLWLLSSALVFLAWLINENIPPRRPPLVNWDSTIFFNRDSEGLWLLPNVSLGYPEPGVHHPSNLLLPTSKEEIAHMIKSALVPSSDDVSATDHPNRIRVIGSGHSWSRIAMSDGLQMSLERYKGVVGVDRQLNQVTVRGGTTFRELNEILDQHGLAMSVLGSTSEQTVAGAISTGTHGTGVSLGNIATMVTKIELVTGKGEILSLSENENPEIFKAAQVSVGLLGVISEVTFQCEPAFNLREVSYTIPFTECLERMSAISYRSEHVKFWVELHSGLCSVFEINKTIEAPRDNPNHKLETASNYFFEGMFCNLVSWIPSLANSIFTFLFTYLEPLPPHDRVDVSHKVFNIPHYFPVHDESEPVVHGNDCPAAVKELRRMVLEERVALNYIVEVRFVKADNIWLSPDYQRDSCHMTLCIYNPSDQTKQHYFYGSFKALAQYNPRLHWGKYFNLTPSEVDKMYPRLRDFLRVRARLDPSGLFLNLQLASSFGLKHLL